MSKRRWITIATVLGVTVLALALSAPRRPVLLSLSPDPTETRPGTTAS
ncbi:MAG TPA: hypothetical protein VF618_17805 [Thermoanaerobaculia bacterium]